MMINISVYTTALPSVNKLDC